MSALDLSMPLSFEAFYKENLAMIRRLVQKYRYFDAAADDMVQDIFLLAWQKLPQLRVPSARRAWLLTLARHRCLNGLRGKRDMVSLSTIDMFGEESMAWGAVLAAPDHAESLRLQMGFELLSEVIAMHQNPERRRVAQLFYEEAMEVREIADICQMNVNTVLSHLRRFRLIAAEAMLALIEERNIGI